MANDDGAAAKASNVDEVLVLGGDGVAFAGFCCFATACQLYDNVVLLENANLYNGLLCNVLAQVVMLAALAIAGAVSSWEPSRSFALASAALAAGAVAFSVACSNQMLYMACSVVGGAAMASLAVCWGCFLGRRPPDQLCLRIVAGLFVGSAVSFVLFAAGSTALNAGALVAMLACAGLPWLHALSQNRTSASAGSESAKSAERSDGTGCSASMRDSRFGMSALMLITLVACSLLSSLFSGFMINPYGVQSKLIDSYMHLITTISFGLLAADCIVAKTLNVQGFTLAALAALLVGLLTLSTGMAGGVVVPVGLIMAVRGLSWGLGWVVLSALSCANHGRRLAVVSIGLLIVGGAVGRGVGVLLSNGSTISFAGLGVFGAVCITLVALAYAALNATGLTSVSVPIGFALRAGRGAVVKSEPDPATAERRDDGAEVSSGVSRSSDLTVFGTLLTSESAVPPVRESGYVLHDDSRARLSAEAEASSSDDSASVQDAAALRLELLRPIGLTDKEADVAILLLGGVVYTDIAERLGISPSTVKFHAKNIYTKAGVQTKREFLRKYSP